MYVDYTSLNKVCPKDLFPLPHINQVIELMAGCELLSFLDAYLGYHQIPLTEAEQPATTFITPIGCFCYTKMSIEEHGGYISVMYVVLLQGENRA
jgi:uncharacterized protein YvpB